MSRCRNIKPALFENELLGQMDGDTVLTFIGLWCIADRQGRLEDRPLRLKAKLFPYRQVSIEAALSQLEKGGFLIRYTVNGEAFIEIVNFLKHQHPHHKEQASEIPPAPKNLRTEEGTNTDLAPTQESRCPSDSLIPHTDSLIPHTDSLIPHTDSLIPHTSKGASPNGDKELEVSETNSKPTKPKKEKPNPDSDPDFVAFWQAYPRKVDKPGTFDVWRKAKLPAIADILAAVEALSATEVKFIPFPARWIKGERWNDQVTTPAREVSEYANF